MVWPAVAVATIATIALHAVLLAGAVGPRVAGVAVGLVEEHAASVRTNASAA